MSTWIYPYERLFGDIDLRLDGLKVDGARVPGNRIDSDRREVRLLELEKSEWERAQLEVTVSGPQLELQERHTPARAIALVHCAASNSRQAIELDADERDPSTWHGRLELERASWFGRIDLRGSIVAEVDEVADRVIGDAEPWTIRLDDVPPPPAHGAIEIRWQEFRHPDEHLAWLKEFEAEPAYLQLDDVQPVLYLNRSFEGLKALLDRKPAREPGEQALHDQTRATIAIEAWTAMFNASIQAIQFDEEGIVPDWPEEGWQRTALEILLERMYPDKTLEDALAEVAERAREPEGGGLLYQQLLTAVSEHVGAPRLLRGAINVLGKSLKEV